jgi:hypothetical protein
MSHVGKWSETAASNNASPPDGWPEGQTKASVNNSAREMMSALATIYRDLEWGSFWEDSDRFTFAKLTDASFRIVDGDGTPVDQTGYFNTGRRVKVNDGGTPVYGIVASTAWSTPNSDITLTMDTGDVIPATPTTVHAYILESIGLAAFENYNDLLRQGRHTVAFPAAAISPRETKGCTPHASYETTEGRPDIRAIAFPDSVAATGAIQVDDYTNLTNAVSTLTVNGDVYTFTTAASTSTTIQIMGSTRSRTIRRA